MQLSYLLTLSALAATALGRALPEGPQDSPDFSIPPPILPEREDPRGPATENLPRVHFNTQHYITQFPLLKDPWFQPYSCPSLEKAHNCKIQPDKPPPPPTTPGLEVSCIQKVKSIDQGLELWVKSPTGEFHRIVGHPAIWHRESGTLVPHLVGILGPQILELLGPCHIMPRLDVKVSGPGKPRPGYKREAIEPGTCLPIPEAKNMEFVAVGAQTVPGPKQETLSPIARIDLFEDEKCQRPFQKKVERKGLMPIIAEDDKPLVRGVMIW